MSIDRVKKKQSSDVNPVKRRASRKPRLIPRIGKVEIEYVDDPELAKQLMRIILLAIELAGKTPEEAEEIQNRFFD